PVDVSLQVRTPFVARKSAPAVLVFLLLLDGKLSVHVTVGLGRGGARQSRKRQKSNSAAGNDQTWQVGHRSTSRFSKARTLPAFQGTIMAFPDCQATMRFLIVSSRASVSPDQSAAFDAIRQ